MTWLTRVMNLTRKMEGQASAHCWLAHTCRGGTAFTAAGASVNTIFGIAAAI